MLTATRREWNELYVFFALLGKGQVDLGNDDGQPSGRAVPIACITRQEYDGPRTYAVHKDEVRVRGEQMDERFLREDFSAVSALLLEALCRCHTDDVEAPAGVEEFLDALKIYDMEARTDDRTDFYITFHDETFPPMGFRIYSRLCSMDPLLDGGRAANLKFEQTGVRFSQPTVSKINFADEPDNPATVARRMLYIESMGGVLKYADVDDKVFRSNLSLIDLNFGRVLGEMVRVMQLDGISRVDELTAIVEGRNPLKIKEELIRRHAYYRHKVKEFLLALALGMRPSKVYDGRESAVAGLLMAGADGRLLAYRKTERQVMADYLFSHTRLEKGSPEKDKYGYLERENRQYFLRLNLKVGFVKK